MFLHLNMKTFLQKKNKTLENISNFLDLKLSNEDFEMSENIKMPSDLKIALNGIRPLDTKSIGIWKKHPVRIWEEFTMHKELHTYMQSLGYEKNLNWFFLHFKEKLPIKIT